VATILIVVTLKFQRHQCVLNQSRNIPAKFDDDRPISIEMATVFEIQDGGNHHVEFLKLCISEIMVAIDQKVMK